MDDVVINHVEPDCFRGVTIFLFNTDNNPVVCFLYPGGRAGEKK
jgi:hypothetical protein